MTFILYNARMTSNDLGFQSLDINGMDEKGFTPLMTAATYNAVECLDVLLEFDPDLDVINPSGKTALMLACQSGLFYRG